MFEPKSIMSGAQLIVSRSRMIIYEAKLTVSKTKTVIYEAHLIICVTNMIIPAPLFFRSVAMNMLSKKKDREATLKMTGDN